LSLEQLYVRTLIKGLTKGEKQAMVKMMTDEFINSMSADERKEMIKIILPDIAEKLMVGTTADDRKELVEFIMAQMVTKMTGTNSTVRDKRENKNQV
jgi:hypothetical protein